MATDAIQPPQTESEDLQTTPHRGFWFSLSAFLGLVTLLLWDYGFTRIFESLSFGSIVVLLTEVLTRGRDPSSKSLVSMFVGWVNGVPLRTRRRARFATVLMLLCFCCVCIYYVVLPPLQFGVMVRNPEKVGPVKLSFEGEPDAVEVNSAGYGFVHIPGFNFGHVTPVSAYSEKHSIRLTTKLIPTTFLWKHRFSFMGSPFFLDVTVEPSSEEMAKQLIQEALDALRRHDCPTTIQKINQALALKDLSEGTRTLLLSIKNSCA